MYTTINKFYNRNSIPDSKLIAECYDDNNNNNFNNTNKKDNLILKWKETDYSNTSNPEVWGPSFWFSLHNGASKYPEHASPIVSARMKGFILGLPEMIPCLNCKEHARGYIENSDLDKITNGKNNLFHFFVDFHNYVNKRYNKPEMSLDEARKLYSGNCTIKYMCY